MEACAGQELLRLTNINLTSGRMQTLKQIYLELGRSEIHAVVGEHGAGKSSLGLMLNGILQPLSGLLIFEGKSYPALTVSLALKLGIRMSYQQVRLYKEFTDDVRNVDKLNLIKMAYTQISAESKLDNQNQEFSQLINRSVCEAFVTKL